MTDYSFGDIVVVPFPFTDQSTVKKRPAVVVSSLAYNTQRPDIIIMAITSQMRPAADFGDMILSDWQAAGLLKPSAIKPVFATIEKRMAFKKLGGISSRDRETLKTALHVIFGESG